MFRYAWHSSLSSVKILPDGAPTARSKCIYIEYALSV